jgi:2-iminobutanoate/2-iminopropanoate deaminase
MKKVLFSEKAPKPIGPYSQAVGYDNFVYTSGQVALGIDGKLISEDVKDQTRQVFENLKNVLEDNGSSLNNVIKVMVFLKDMKDFSQMNEVYAEYFTESFPARSTVAVAALPLDARVEIEVISYKNT